MKVKTEKQLNLPQLIEWAMENGIKNNYYVSENRYIVTFDENGFLENATLPLDEIFTVIVEEVVDSDTVLDNIYTVNVEVGNSHTTYYKSKSINDVKTDEINIVYTILQEEAIVLWDSQGGFR